MMELLTGQWWPAAPYIATAGLGLDILGTGVLAWSAWQRVKVRSIAGHSYEDKSDTWKRRRTVMAGLGPIAVGFALQIVANLQQA